MIKTSIRCFGVAVFIASSVMAAPKHGAALYDDPKYKADFQHFDYVNPDAPKGGKLTLSAAGTFDSVNHFIIRGTSAIGVDMIYDTLMVQAQDEPFSVYGLLAESIDIADDNSSVTFKLRPEAKFFNGSPVTAADVVFTFNKLITEGKPRYRSYYADIDTAEAIDDHTVKFMFKVNTNKELPLILGQLPVFSKAYYASTVFNKTTLEPIMASGPYRIATAVPGRFIKFARNQDYWAKDLPVNKGRFNFDEIQIDYYRDRSIAFEAFKSNDYDWRMENISKNWAKGYDFPAVKNKQVVLREQVNNLPSGMQGFVFNLRRDKFKDVRVREAIGLAYDFEWANKNLFHGIYKRTLSHFDNTELAAKDVPTGKELALLKPFEKDLPENLFIEPFELPVNNRPNSMRYNLRKALTLLKDAGWEQKKDGLTNVKTGEIFEFEILIEAPTFERVIAPFILNLEKLGIKAKTRLVDGAQYETRKSSFDFDMLVHVYGASISPGNEQLGMWGSDSADRNGSPNIAGVKNDVVDKLVQHITSAKTREELVAATRALDRVLLWQYYVIPHWYSGKYRLAYWDKFGYPETSPKYGLNFPEGWWDKTVTATPAAAE